MRVFQRVLIVVVTLLLGSIAQADMTALNDDGLAQVAGGAAGNGIAFELYTQINTDTTGTPLSGFGTGCATNSTTAGTCSAVLALQFSGRQGSWLVLKDYYGSLSVPTLYLDAYVNPTTNTSYWNQSRFKNSSGACISDISSCNPAGMASFSFTFPSVSTTNFQDIGLYLNIGRMAIEYDNTATSCATVNSATGTNCGYNQDSFGSFAGVIVSDTSDTTTAASGLALKQAQISVAGRVRMYGF